MVPKALVLVIAAVAVASATPAIETINAEAGEGYTLKCSTSSTKTLKWNWGLTTVTSGPDTKYGPRPKFTVDIDPGKKYDLVIDRLEPEDGGWVFKCTDGSEDYASYKVLVTQSNITPPPPTKTLVAYAGQSLTMKCAPKTGSESIQWYWGNSKISVGTSISYGPKPKFTVDIEAGKKYDLIADNLGEEDSGWVFKCSYGKQQYESYKVVVYPAEWAPENNKDSCFSFLSNDRRCGTPLQDYCSTYKCIKPQDCNAKDVQLCGPVTEDEKKEILDKHNEFRQKIASGEETQGYLAPHPAGTNINELKWSDEIAQAAQLWAEQENWTPDCPACRKTPNYDELGQIILVSEYSYKTWTDMINWMYRDVKNYNYATGKKNFSRDHTERFTQVVWAKTKLIGCGRFRANTNCAWAGRCFRRDNACTKYVCNYYPAGNKEGEKPYSTTEKCSSYSTKWNKLCA